MASVGLLIYLSIVNIAGYRDLLQIRVVEEEQEIARAFAGYVEQLTNALTENVGIFFNAENVGDNSFKDAVSNWEGVEDYIIYESNTGFLRPLTAKALALRNVRPNIKFQPLIVAGEVSEFRKMNYSRAANQYRTALKSAKSKSDTAYIYNLISRVEMRSGQIEKSLSYSDSLINDYGSEVSEFGFPFAYFAVDRFLKLDPSIYPETQVGLMNDFLTGMSDNRIPLNINTAEILDSIESRINVIAPSQYNDLLNLTGLIRDRVRLYENYSQLEDESFVKDHFGNGGPGHLTQSFVVVDPLSGDYNETMLYFNNVASSVGLVMNIDSVLLSFNDDYSFESLSFEYRYSIKDRANPAFLSTDPLITVSDFSPVFQNAIIEVGLKEIDSIDNKVLRRRFYFGIGLFLFLLVLGLGIYLLINDIQREKRLHRLRADFVSRVTHELKTPLTSINMFAEAIYMEEPNMDNKISKYSRIIVKESEKLKNMINNILDFSKSENEPLKYVLQKRNLTRVIQDALSDLDYFININNIDMEVNLQDEVYSMINEAAIKQALSNLVSNAIKYSVPSKKIIVSLSKNDAFAVIGVEDFGLGIPEDQIGTIFEKFYRVESSYNDSIPGTGLGLTVTKAIVTAHNGQIKVASQLGKGSKFSIFIPVT
jgi:signal transduction histidine kinase